MVGTDLDYPEQDLMICATPPKSVADLVGNTPLLRMQRLGRDFPDVELYAKAEWFNPGGSVKDRPALNMVLAAEREGLLGPHKTLLDATSGNTGIAYAMLGAARGFPVKLCMPANASIERKRILHAYGAELVITDPLQGSDGAIREARRLSAEDPERYFYCDQYSNDNNWLAHYHGTAAEIWEQTEGRITHFVAGLGTSGTFMGTSRRLKECNRQIRCLSFQPEAFPGIEGLKHMATAIVPRIYDPEVADDDREITADQAFEMVKQLARQEGLLVGLSSGAAIACALQVAAEVRRGVIVTVFPDGGDKYLSLPFWDEF
jgi:cysteine synthase B